MFPITHSSPTVPSDCSVLFVFITILLLITVVCFLSINDLIVLVNLLRSFRFGFRFFSLSGITATKNKTQNVNCPSLKCETTTYSTASGIYFIELEIIDRNYPAAASSSSFSASSASSFSSSEHFFLPLCFLSFFFEDPFFLYSYCNRNNMNQYSPKFHKLPSPKFQNGGVYLPKGPERREESNVFRQIGEKPQMMATH